VIGQASRPGSWPVRDGTHARGHALRLIMVALTPVALSAGLPSLAGGFGVL
jgi:hypothetical protein